MSTDQLDLSAFAPDAPGWYPDPDGRHQYRYHDGSVWTDHVADDGQSVVDPRSPSLPPPVMPVMDDEVVVLEPDVTEPYMAEPELAEPELAEPPAGASVLAPPMMTIREPEWPAQEPMGLDEAVRRGFRQYASFSGRAPRSEYWGFMAVTQLFVLLAGVLPAFAIAGLVRGTDAALIIGSVLLFFAALAVALPSLAVSVRRLHDSDRKGTALLFGLIPLAGPVIVTVFMLRAGTRGPNQYGEPVVPTGPPSPPLAAIATYLRLPALVGLFFVILMSTSEMERAAATMRTAGPFLVRWVVASVTVALFATLLLAGRRRTHSLWLLAMEGAVAVVLGLAPQLPSQGPWLFTEFLRMLSSAGIDVRWAFYGFANGLALMMGVVWLGVVVTTATRVWWTEREVS